MRRQQRGGRYRGICAISRPQKSVGEERCRSPDGSETFGPAGLLGQRFSIDHEMSRFPRGRGASAAAAGFAGNISITSTTFEMYGLWFAIIKMGASIVASRYLWRIPDYIETAIA